jgi:parvulin-like peptidyl-prolyl isomerase
MKTTSKLFALTLALACAAPAAAVVVDGLAARVNDEPITISDYNKAKDALADQYTSAMPDFFKQKDADEQLAKAALDKLIDEALLRQKAEALKIKVYERELENGVAEIRKRFAKSPTGEDLSPEKADAAFQAELKKEDVTMDEFRDRIRKQLMVQKLVQDTIKTKAKMPGDDETKAYFDKIVLALNGDTDKLKGLSADDMQDLTAVANRFKALTSERLRVRHILIKEKEDATPEEKKAAHDKALEVKKAMDGGMDFDDAVTKYSEDQESAARGGDLGYVVKGMLPPEVEAVAFKMQVGENSDPVESKFGWHILRLEEKRAAQKLRYDSVKDDIEQILSQNAFATELASYIKDLRKDAKVEVFLDAKTLAADAPDKTRP